MFSIEDVYVDIYVVFFLLTGFHQNMRHGKSLLQAQNRGEISRWFDVIVINLHPAEYIIGN